MYLDYGFTRPNVMSRGPVSQSTGELGTMPIGDTVIEGPMVPNNEPTPAGEWDQQWPAAEAGAMDDPAEQMPASGVQPAGYEQPMQATRLSGVEPASYHQPAGNARITYASPTPTTNAATPASGQSSGAVTLNPYASAEYAASNEDFTNHSTAEATQNAGNWRNPQR
jgi:hypothetical protein